MVQNIQPGLHSYKILLLGDSKVDKTAFQTRIVFDKFPPKYEYSIADLSLRTQTILNNQVYLLDIEDTPADVIRIYKTDAIILMYDVTSRSSFERLRTWYGEIQQIKESYKLSGLRECSLEDARVVCLVSNKADLDRGGDGISRHEGLELAKEFDCLFFEVSCKTGVNIDLTLEHIIRDLRQHEQDSAGRFTLWSRLRTVIKCLIPRIRILL
ncbi:P-loop containing nucleoside triphosphate hydrolase protein [Tothia fuscella]|uniref:P-loop containing nucleoside triphosphate hydrolase protein n=1 Tax=Tothia fuscella TaxID=1048955 RepID=A0A9P4U2F3_9PEZI|nr:P-loop containing nucleoside triphosphate hydrolase protein [Tothia fuscella]